MRLIEVASYSVRRLFPNIMSTVTRRFQGFDALIDDTHDLFDTCQENGTFSPPLSTNGLERVRLAVHEWLANLVQHADFACREPWVELTISSKQQRLHCIIEDNSEGFDIDPHLEAPPDILKTYPERGMGLMMLKSSTAELSYRQMEEKRYCLEFFVDPK